MIFYPLDLKYTWEAEKPDGTVITSGGDLAGCARFSLIPAQGSLLPRHDITGVRMIRRFGRGFLHGLGGGLKEYIHCVVCKGFRLYVRYSDGTVLITPQTFELYL